MIIGGGYFGYKNLTGDKDMAKYVMAAVERGTIIVSVSGSGQVSAFNQIEIKPKVSSEVVAVYVFKGEEVKTGKLIMKLDDTDFRRAVKDAETSLETAKLELEELMSPPDELTLLQAENSLAQAEESKQKAQDNIKKTYEDSFNNIADAFLNFPTIMAGIYDVLFSYNFSVTQQNIDYYSDAVKIYEEKVLQYKTDAYNKYQAARTVYEKNFQDYKSTSRFSDTEIIESLINQTYETTKDIAEAIKSANNLIQLYQDKLIERGFKPQTLSNTHLSNLNTYTGKTNSYLLTLLSSQRTIQDNKEAIIDAKRMIEEKELSLAKLKAGADELDIRAKKIVIQQKEDALSEAEQNLAGCYIYSFFDGVIADVGVKVGDSVSSGTELGILITKQKIAEISLNEVDAAKVKIGQKTTLTFDALPDLSISGKVLEVDTIGTTSQGVVSYGVKIFWDIQDERIKPGMSVAVDIIIDIKQDVLILSNNAVKSQEDSYYVELVEASEETKQQLLANKSGVILSTPIKQQVVEIGLSNDLYTEIISGLKEGDIVVGSIISSTTQTQTNQSQRNQEFQIPGL
ncbi:hypothetical protein A2Z67_02995 [Candidatus Woesebacteria bacterium RBG_13_36_22]|uniref:YknX-like beta-barrel domain-containing protein n=1 Tax=Candidatus Woesebacteria bacterium RBG_13_36_22 TaxID=1802478 RepID=A0A1F7X635_9BACT|nr:MAG: hypothetical protein A2Z67_02995 [Candidatus Woesebacteria bacterium RBG_13_36_22]